MEFEEENAVQSAIEVCIRFCCHDLFFVFSPPVSYYVDYYVDFLHVMCKKQEAFVNLHADGGMK